MKKEYVDPINYESVNLLSKNKKDLQLYAMYVMLQRYVTDYRDGLKPVQRRILYSMFEHLHANKQLVKSSKITGDVIGTMHPHGESSVYSAMKPMCNDFETKVPLLQKHGNWGNFKGDEAAASRYTEARVSDFSLDVMLGELKENNSVVDWQPNYDRTSTEPIFLPAKLPMLIINGTFAIAVGFSVDIPPHNLAEVVDVCVSLLDDPTAPFMLIPDYCMPCEIIVKSKRKMDEFVEINQTGKGKFLVRGIIEDGEDAKGRPYIHIKSTPDANADKVKAKIEELVSAGKLPQIMDGDDVPDGYIYTLRKGTSVDFVKDIIYSKTPIQITQRVNFVTLDGIRLEQDINYRDYLLAFLEFRKTCKARIYKALYKKASTRYHEIEAFIKILSSHEEKKIIDMITKSKATEDQPLIDYLTKKFDMTDLQAMFIINANLKRLSAGYLAQYKAEAKELTKQMNDLYNIITNPKMIIEILKKELLDLKAKYGKPRTTRVISMNQAKNKPECRVCLSIDNLNNIAKTLDTVAKMDNQIIHYIPDVDNNSKVLLFSSRGVVYGLDVSVLPFANGKKSSICNISSYIPRLTSDIVACFPLEKLEHMHGSTVTISTFNGCIKKLDLTQFAGLTGNMTYVVLNDGDYVKSVKFTDDNTDVVIFTTNGTVLRIPSSKIPCYTRHAKGMNGLNGTFKISTLDNVVSTLIIITKNGYINKIHASALPRAKKIKEEYAETVIRLSKGDSIFDIFAVSDEDILHAIDDHNKDTVIPIKDIPDGSSIAKGEKMLKSKHLLKTYVETPYGIMC